MTTTTCKGLVYRAKVSQYISGDTIGERTYLKILKRKSCPGCEACGHMEEMFQEDIEQYGSAVDMSHVEDGVAYRLVLDISHPSYEYPDEVEAEFKLIEVKGV